MKRVFSDIQDFGDDEDVDEDDGNDNSKKYQNKTGAIIFLIDAREKMFLPSFEETKIPFVRCLECIRSAIRSKIFNSEKCFCSIMLLGTKKIKNLLELNNICVVQELKLLGAEHVLTIDEIIKAVDENTYEKEFGYDKFSLGDAFWLSSHMFNKRSKNIYKTVMLFTNDDNPTSVDKNDENRTVASAQDMNKTSTVFDLIHLGKDFDVNKFYKKIILASLNDANYVIPDPVTSIEEMIARVSKTNHKHVILVKLPFVISKDFTIGVSVHYLVRKMKIPFKIKLSKSTNERVTTKMQFFEADTGSLVKEDDLIKTQVVAQQDINFRPNELKAISEIGKSEIRLLGFKPASTLRLENFVKPCAFIYPDESTYKGSSVFFTALLKKCIEKQVVAICTFCMRTTSACRFVALIGQDEYLRDDKNQELPPGFVVFFLPFAEEVRTMDEKTTKRAEPESVDIAVKLIKKLKFKYKVDSFYNPKLKTHWAAIEALALDLKEADDVNDCTIPNYDLISQRTGKIAKEFIESVYAEGYDPELFSAPKKPKPVKKTVEKDFIDVEKAVREGKGERLSNDVLKSYLASVGLGKNLSKTKKSDLLEKIRNHLNFN